MIIDGNRTLIINGNQIKKPDGSFLEIKDLTKVNNDNPQDMNIGVALNKNGDKKAVYQFKMDGQTYTTNLSDLTDNYLKSSFDVRSNIRLNVQTAMSKGGATFGYKDEPRMFTSETKETTEDGKSITELKGFEGIVDTQTPGGDGLGYFTNADNAAKLFAGDLYKTSSSPGNNSSFHALAKRLYNKDFISVVDGEVIQVPTTKDETAFINELKALPNDVKLAMQPLDKPPFYGAEAAPADIGTCGGCKVNKSAQVIDTLNRPIKRLCSSGNNSGVGSPGTSYGGGGGTIGPALTFAFIAGKTLSSLDSWS